MIGVDATAAGSAQENLWQQSYEARQKYFEHTVGPFPKDIQKMLNMSGVWPDGGLYAIPAQRLGEGLVVYTTFGLTNADMPTTVRVIDFNLARFGGEKSYPRGRKVGEKAARREASGSSRIRV